MANEARFWGHNQANIVHLAGCIAKTVGAGSHPPSTTRAYCHIDGGRRIKEKRPNIIDSGSCAAGTPQPGQEPQRPAARDFLRTSATSPSLRA